MTSSSEAFVKFSIWKNEKRELCVHVIESGAPEEVLFGRIYGTDETKSIVGIVGQAPHSFGDFDISGADFSLGSSRLVVTKGSANWLVFEDFGPC